MHLELWLGVWAPWAVQKVGRLPTIRVLVPRCAVLAALSQSSLKHDERRFMPFTCLVFPILGPLPTSLHVTLTFIRILPDTLIVHIILELSTSHYLCADASQRHTSSNTLFIPPPSLSVVAKPSQSFNHLLEEFFSAGCRGLSR